MIDTIYHWQNAFLFWVATLCGVQNETVSKHVSVYVCLSVLALLGIVIYQKRQVNNLLRQPVRIALTPAELLRASLLNQQRDQKYGGYKVISKKSAKICKN
jgi:hypothetical protein